MCIYTTHQEFSPTYLCVKQHSVTGKLYFCKTTKSYDQMLQYVGSGTYWRKHLRRHGEEHVITLWYCLFTERESCIGFALSFSAQENIVESNNWANLRPENGIDGVITGSSMGEKTKRKISESSTGKQVTEAHANNISSAKLGKKRDEFSQEWRNNIGRAMAGRPSHVAGKHWWTDGLTNILAKEQPNSEFSRGRTL